jgi:hypothetical protein
MRIGTRLKVMFHRPFTSADLGAVGASIVAHPPVPDDYRDLAATRVEWYGDVSLVDYWREKFLAELQEVSEQPTWKTQRAAVLRILLRQSGWFASQGAANQARHPASWAHLVVAHKAFADLEDDDPRRPTILGQIWLAALLSAAAWRGIGERLYAIDKVKQLELKAHGAYDQEIKQFDVASLDLVVDHVAHGNDAQALAEIKDNQINPIIRNQYSILHRMAEDIVNGSLDVKRVMKQHADVEARRQALLESLRQSSM